MAVFYLKNESGGPISIDDLGLYLLDDTSREIDKNEINGYLSSDLSIELNAGNLVLSTTDIGNSSGDLIAADSIAALSITSRYDRDNPHKATFTQVTNEDSNTDITAAEAETLTDGSESSLLHIHDDRYYTETELSASNPSTVEVHWDNIINSPQFGALHWRQPVIANTIEAGDSTAMNAFSTMIEGDYWWNDDDHLYKYESSSWVDQGAPSEGDRIIYRDGVSSDDKIYTFSSSAWDSGIMPEDNWALIVDDDHGGPAQYVYDSTTTDPPNWIKIADIDWGTHNSIGGRDATDSHPGEAITYDPSKEPSGLSSINVQDAIDEIDDQVDTNATDISNHDGDTSNPHVVTFTQAVSEDSNTDITTTEAETLTDGSDADALHFHSADNIVYSNSVSGLTAIDVQAAIDEIMSTGIAAEAIFIYVDKNRTDSYIEDGSPSHPYKTIAAAIAAVAGAATIYVGEGTYTENTTLPNDVSLWGIGIGKTTINGNITTGTSPNCTLKDFSVTGITDINCTSVALNVYSTGTVITDSDLQTFNFTIISTGAALTIEDGVVNFNSSSIVTTDENSIVQSGGELILNSIKVENNSASSETIVSDTANVKILQSSVINLGGGASFDINNGATSTNPNVLSDVIYYGTATLGTAYTIVEGTHDLSSSVRIPSGTNRILRPGEQIDYDPTKEPSGLTSTNVQDAIDEIDSNVDTSETDISNHVGDTSNPHTVTFTQAVSEDAGTDISAAEAETLTDGSNADSLHDHAASNITFDDSTAQLGETDVQGAIEAIDFKFDNFLPRGTSFPTNPSPIDGDLYYRTDLNLTFQYDSSRSEWLSITHMSFDWGSGTADGKYLNIHGAVATQTGYLMPRNGTILTLTARTASGNQSKGLEIRSNHNAVAPLKSFSLSSGVYNSATENIDFSAGDYVQAFAVSAGVSARDLVVMITIAWRE